MFIYTFEWRKSCSVMVFTARPVPQLAVALEHHVHLLFACAHQCKIAHGQFWEKSFSQRPWAQLTCGHSSPARNRRGRSGGQAGNSKRRCPFLGWIVIRSFQTNYTNVLNYMFVRKQITLIQHIHSQMCFPPRGGSRSSCSFARCLQIQLCLGSY